ncbi:hypothetical protein SK128_008250, partial [Halocaridina rubra]
GQNCCDAISEKAMKTLHLPRIRKREEEGKVEKRRRKSVHYCQERWSEEPYESRRRAAGQITTCESQWLKNSEKVFLAISCYRSGEAYRSTVDWNGSLGSYESIRGETALHCKRQFSNPLH